MSHATFRFPLRKVGSEQWCSLANMGISRVDVVAYKHNLKEKHSFAGGHRHRYVVMRDDVHILLPLEQEWDISAVTQPPRRKHGKQR